MDIGRTGRSWSRHGEPPTSIHRIHAEFDRITPPAELVIAGAEAHHAARVKRLSPGDRVELRNGRGLIARCECGEARKSRGGRGDDAWELPVRVLEVRSVPPVVPRVEVWACTPKGPRAEEMIDALAQSGACSWSPMSSDHNVVDPRGRRLERLERVAREAGKQCGRAWDMALGPERAFGDAVSQAGGVFTALAHAPGAAYRAVGAHDIRLLIGPEGGWSERELARASDAGIEWASFGPHVLRIELAAPLACAIIIDQEHRARVGPSAGGA